MLAKKETTTMSIVNVKEVSHVALKTRNVERQATFYTNIVGLGETEQDAAGRVYLRCNANHHTVVHKTDATFDHGRLAFLFANGRLEPLCMNTHLQRRSA